MRKRLLLTIAVLAAAGLAAGAVPAFTADNGSVAVTITAQAAATPCITVAPTTLDFGTLSLSAPGSLSTRFIGQNGLTPTVTNCGTVGQEIFLASSNATGASGSWTPGGQAVNTNPCPAINTFNLSANRDGVGQNFFARLSGSPVPALADNGQGSYVQSPGASDLFGFQLDMPCQGSNGAGEQKALTVTFTGVIP